MTDPSPSFDAIRVRKVNRAAPRPEGDFVLYWMIAHRRLEWNHALERAVDWARALDRPLLIFEALRAGYRWASPRLHRFCIDGMAEHAERLEGSRVGYFPWVEPEPGAGKGLLEALAARAAVVVTDEFPSFFIPRMVEAAGEKLGVRLEAVDANGLLPIARHGQRFISAYLFRRHLQRVLPEHLSDLPREHPLTGDPLRPFAGIPTEVAERWPATPRASLERGSGLIESIGLDAGVQAVPARGGRKGGLERLERFLQEGLPGYAEGRKHPDEGHPSGLSPWLHWGHIASHEVVRRVLASEEWNPSRLGGDAKGARQGWWGASADVEAFLDQIVTWRELGYGTAWNDPDHERYESLPDWALATLDEHRDDPRPHLYDLEAFEEARTHDPIWNAAQGELRETGVIHNYLRMLWGKKILEWSSSPEEALETMIHLNNRWGLDGRNPNSTSGIFWILGRYDRGWPERPVFGTVRSMSSDSTRRKVRLDRYLERFGG